MRRTSLSDTSHGKTSLQDSVPSMLYDTFTTKVLEFRHCKGQIHQNIRTRRSDAQLQLQVSVRLPLQYFFLSTPVAATVPQRNYRKQGWPYTMSIQ